MSGYAVVVLIFQIFITIAMVGIILLQRSEGGALGIGGGSGSFLSAAGAGNALTRTTMILGALFFATNILMTVLDHNDQHQLKLGTLPAKAALTHSATPPAPVSVPPVSGTANPPPLQSVPDAAAPPAMPPANAISPPQPVAPAETLIFSRVC